MDVKSMSARFVGFFNAFTIKWCLTLELILCISPSTLLCTAYFSVLENNEQCSQKEQDWDCVFLAVHSVRDNCLCIPGLINLNSLEALYSRTFYFNFGNTVLSKAVLLSPRVQVRSRPRRLFFWWRQETKTLVC